MCELYRSNEQGAAKVVREGGAVGPGERVQGAADWKF